jgi:hypothetical protein
MRKPEGGSMKGIRRHLTYANVVATLALFAAIAGGTTAIAVSKGGKNTDVNKKGNIRAGRVTTPKLADGAVTASKLAAGNVTASRLAGIDLVQATGTSLVTASCPGGERLLSGGAVSLGPGFELVSSAPNETGAGWSGSGGGQAGVRVIALCLKGTPGP